MAVATRKHGYWTVEECAEEAGIGKDSVLMYLKNNQRAIRQRRCASGYLRRGRCVCAADWLNWLTDGRGQA